MRRSPLWLSTLGLVVGMLGAGIASADLTGRWLLERDYSPPEIATVTDTGGTLTFSVPSIPLTLTGAVSGSTFGVSATTSSGCGVGINGQVFSGETRFFARELVAPCFLTFEAVRGTRCQCFDGNTTNGDGCDARCQIEPCFTCTGDPSVCTPTPDGGACDDGDACTSGETCSAGTCGGGSPVAPPCVNLTGRWTITETVNGFPSYTQLVDVVQMGTGLDFRDLGGGIIRFGAVDPATGAFDLPALMGTLICQVDSSTGIDPLTGTASLDGGSLSGTGVISAGGATTCLGFGLSLTGTRCPGGGCLCSDGLLDAGETCDDGNLNTGDGCNASCQVEECWSCTGQPSVCTPLPDGTACAIGCVTGATCHSGSCTGGTPVICEPCATCVVGVGCVTAPSATCSAPSPGASGLTLRNGTDPGHARIGVTWRSDAGGAIDFGNPVSSDDYALCLFDESSATPALLFSATAPAGGTCAGKPCWTAVGSAGFAYADPDATPDGLRKLRLTKSTRGRVKLSVKGAGPLLSGRPFGLPSPPLSLPLRMELRGENGMCLGATYGPGGVLRNVPGAFKARTP